MEIIIITSIVVAVFGLVALAWVLSQGSTPTGATPLDETTTADAAAEAAATDTTSAEAPSAPESAHNPIGPAAPAEHARPEPPPIEPAAPKVTSVPPPVRSRSAAPERSAFDGLAAFAAPDHSNEPIENIPTSLKSEPESVTALRMRPGTELEVPGHPLRLNAIDLIASQIETLYEQYVKLDEERSRLAQELLTNMLFEKIERTSGRLEIVTEQATLDLRKELIKVSAEYDRVQFRLGALQHLNARLGDPRVAHQIEELVMTVRALAGER